MDFTNAQGTARNIGVLPISGGYVYYPNSAAPNAPVGVTFQDNAANGGLWSSTFAYDGARLFSMISDPFRTTTNVGLHAIYINQTNPTKAGNAVKCMRDPNMSKIGNFATQYYKTSKESFQDGLYNPNSYIVLNQNHLQIPVNKAFSVYNQLLSDQQVPAFDNLVAKVLWSSNINLITSVQVIPVGKDGRFSLIDLQINPTAKGNAVISLHNNDLGAPALWSWHIWAPEDDPTATTVTYSTEAPIPTAYNFINASASKLPPLKTEFMDRNLGAESSVIESGLANGLHYQWGRKDPIPNFLTANNQAIHTTSGGGRISGQNSLVKPQRPRAIIISSKEYGTDYTDSYQNYGSTKTNKNRKIWDNILYSINNPMRFLYQNNTGNIYDGGNHYANDLSKVNDWVSNERGAADNRWGHGDKKSPFDPCPEGWRVPDVSFTNLYTGSKGNSPWYNGYKNDAYGKPGVIQDQWHPISTYYEGTVVGQSGWKFESPTFNIGNFPNDGIRGELGGRNIQMDRSGVWTASLADYNTGFALALQFQGVTMQTGTGVYPQAGMSVRCAKDDKRLMGRQIPKNKEPIVIEKKPQNMVGQMEDDQLKVYPNPFQDQFNVKSKDAESVELYDLSGKFLLKTKLENGTVNARSLLKGIYLVKIIMKDQTFVTKKMIKQ